MTTEAAGDASGSPARKGRSMILRIALSVVIGGVLGFGYYKLIGCRGGTCPLTSNPYVSTLWGAAMGLVFGMQR